MTIFQNDLYLCSNLDTPDSVSAVFYYSGPISWMDTCALEKCPDEGRVTTSLSSGNHSFVFIFNALGKRSTGGVKTELAKNSTKLVLLLKTITDIWRPADSLLLQMMKSFGNRLRTRNA